MIRHPALIWTLVVLQAACGSYFLWEIVASVLGLPTLPLRWQARELVQIGASFGLVLGAGLGVMLALTATRALGRAETAQRLTAGEFVDVVNEYFTARDLSPAETDIAWFLMKGLSINEIAELRGTQPGTIKAQCAAIYRKFGVNGKSQLFSLIVEDVML